MCARAAAFLLCCIALGCAPVVPSVPSVDAGRRRDASADAADHPPEAGYQRPDAPTLPAADLAVVLPFEGPEATVDLEARASLGRLDVVFSIDTTGSFGGEIDALQTDLSDRIVPALEATVADVAFAVTRFEDMPVDPFGVATDRPYELLTAVTTDSARVGSAVAQLDLPLGNGGDLPEAGFEALFQIATGDGLGVGADVYAEPWSGRAALGGGRAPGVGFRDGALRVVVHVTDAPSHDAGDYVAVIPDAHSGREALEALNAASIRFIGVASNEVARPDLEMLARGTGSFVPADDGGCHTGRGGARRPATADGCVLVFDVDPDGTGLSDAIVDAIGDLTDALAYAETYGEADDDRLRFVRAIEAVEALSPVGGTPPTRADLRPVGDGFDDTFRDVRSGTRVSFRAHLQNLSIPPADYDQVFRVTIRVVGDGLVLDERTVRVTVPAGRLDAGAPDASERDAGGTPDAGTPDAGTPDAGTPDAGTSGTGATDSGAPDGGATDASLDA